MGKIIRFKDKKDVSEEAPVNRTICISIPGDYSEELVEQIGNVLDKVLSDNKIYHSTPTYINFYG